MRYLSTTIMSKTANRSASQELVLVENQLQVAKLHQNRMSQYSSIQFINLLCYTLRNNDFKVMAVTLWHQNHMQVFLLHFFFTCSSVNNTALNLKINSINLSFFFHNKNVQWSQRELVTNWDFEQNPFRYRYQ